MLILTYILLACGCKETFRTNTPLQINQEQYIQGQYELCYNQYINFDNYIVHGPDNQDSIKWYRYLGTGADWDQFASGNPIEIPVNNNGSFQYVSYLDGDSTSDQFDIVHCFRHVFVSSGFTPNYDGNNDVWKPSLSDDTQSITSYYLRIMTTNGLTLFETGSIQTGWDGNHNSEPMPNGTYLYYIRIEFNDNTYSEYSGELTSIA